MAHRHASSVIGASAWLAFGGALGAALPLPEVEAEPPPPIEQTARVADPQPPQGASQTTRGLDAFADPCLGIRAAMRHADELSDTVELARRRFAIRYGEPMEAPPDFDPDAEEARWTERLADYPHPLWSAVDCTLYPCTALVVSDRPRPSSSIVEDARSAVGIEDAWVVPETRFLGNKAFDVVTIALVDGASLHRGWRHSLRTRMLDLHVADIREAMQAAAGQAAITGGTTP